MRLVTRLVREPLLHFLLAGTLLFIAFDAIRPPASDMNREEVIVVDRAALLGFIEYRAGTYDPERFAAALDALTEAELQQLIDAYIEEETLYREARTLNLDQDDRVIHQRLVQKIRVLLGETGAPAAVDEAAITAYFQAHRDNYTIEPTLTFTHIFFDADRRGDGAAAAAGALPGTLVSGSAGAGDPEESGDRFPYFRNYVERTVDYVASHFGDEFAAAVMALEPSATRWYGPLRSSYGWHRVLLTERTAQRPATLEEVRETVIADFARDRADTALAQAVGRLRERYRVEIGPIRNTSRP